jgi:hypothetical protein
MTKLTRFSKSEELVGMQFEGTPDSAKTIVDWIKEIIGEDQYQRGIMQRLTAKSNLGYDGREWYTGEAVLHISIKALPETYSLNAPTGSYIVYDPNELEVRFRVTGPVHIAGFKREDISADIQEN